MQEGAQGISELDKCMASEIYDCHDKIFLDMKEKARHLVLEYNALDYANKARKTQVLKELFGGIGENASVRSPFLCDHGCNIYLGNNVSVNMNCTFIDCNKIIIGDNVLIGPNVQLYTAAHPVELAQRLTPDWDASSGEYFCRTYSKPITIEDGCWLGGGVIVLPGVTIGRGSVIGAGSVVTRDIPNNVIAFGNPCRVARRIN